MKATDEDRSIDSEEIIEENKKDNESSQEKTEVKPEIITAKYTRPPAFQKWNSFWKWNFQNTNNNRQRPGRAAWRWR